MSISAAEQESQAPPPRREKNRGQRLAAFLATMAVAGFALWKLNNSFSDGGSSFLKHHYLVLIQDMNETETAQRFLRLGLKY